MRRGTSWVFLVAMGLIISLAACGPGATTVPLEEPTPTPMAVQTTPTPEATVEATPELVAEATPTETPPEELFVGSSEALKGLESYRYFCLFKFKSKEEGQVTAGSIEIKGEYVAPDKQHVTWTDLSSGEGFEVIVIGDKAWFKVGDQWMEMETDYVEGMMEAALLFGPVHSWEALYTGLPGTSNLVGKEVVNGIPCLHYSSSYEGWGALFGGGIAEAKGDVWIAEEGFPVKYLFTASGTDSEGRGGSIEWSMELTEVNQAISIKPPM